MSARRCFLKLLVVSLLQATSLALSVGADRLFEEKYLHWIKGKRIGLITNPTGVNHDLESTLDLLARRSDLQLVALFGPEHGLYGQAQAGKTITSFEDVYSLYGESKTPTPEILANVDVLIYDMQDVGVRFYTYISTLYESMKAAAKKGIPFIVLDRPSPVDGSRVEGPVLERGFESFVGVHALPVRYGMTPGELASLFNSEAEIHCDLRIVPMRLWQRHHWFDQTDLEWIMPSPNMPTLTTAIVYPGLCFIEGTNLSEGRGTTRPFELLGAPWLDSRALANRLNRLKLSGVRFRPQAFTPSFSKYQGDLCYGIQVHVSNRKLFKPIPVALHILSEIRKLHPQEFEFKDKNFDRLAGNGWIRESLLKGEAVDEIVKRWQPGLKGFLKIREKYLLYR